MRTSYSSVSSARRPSSWLIAVLGLAAYVGLIYGLTVLPLQFEVPLPHWGALAVPAVAYGVLVLIFVRRPSVLRWIVGTAVLTGLHVLLGLAREPLTTTLDPALAGRPLPWMLPPPVPELIGVFLLLVPLRDVLRARPRLPRERTSSTGRPSSGVRGRAVVAPRLQQAAPTESLESLSEALVAERAAATEPLAAPATMPAPGPMTSPEPVPMPRTLDEPRRRRAAARPERRSEPVARAALRSDVVLRIALDRIMGQLPPGTFLAPEDEVAASLRDPGHLLIPGELVVTQLSEGVARIAWSDIVDQFPPQLVGLGSAEISEHLGDGLRLPLDEVVGQLPHELFVAETPEVEMAGLDRIPVPFHPMEESAPAPSLSRAAAVEAQPTPVVERPRIAPGPAVPDPLPPISAVVPPVIEPRVATPTPPATVTAAPSRVEEPLAPAPVPLRAPESAVRPVTAGAAVPPPPAFDGPTVRVSFSRVAPEMPTECFSVPLEQVAERMHQPGALLVPQFLVLPQLAEGLIRVKWDVVAAQFPRDLLTVADADMMARLPNGISLPLDEVIAQVPSDLFLIGGSAVDVRGLESFPAPFQPLVSDPAPEPPKAVPVERPAPPAEPEPVVVAPSDLAEPEPVTVVTADVAMEEGPPTPRETVEVELPITPETRVGVESGSAESRVDEHPVMSAPVADPEPEATSVGEPEWSRPQAPEPIVAPPVELEVPAPPVVKASEPLAEPEPPRVATSWRDIAPPAPIPAAIAAGTVEIAQARRIVAMLAPVASFDVNIQSMEGVTVIALAAPAVAQEIPVAVAGIALPLLTDRRAPWPLDQITLRGADTALVLTPLDGSGDRGSVLAAATPRGGGLALLEILCRRAAGDRAHGAVISAADGFPGGGRGLVASATPERAAGLASTLTAFGAVTASVLRDTGGEGLLYFFLPAEADVPMVGALAQELQAVMRKAVGSGAAFRTAVLRAGSTFLVIQPEEVGHGRSIVVVAGGEVTRPGLAYRQVERATAALAQA